MSQPPGYQPPPPYQPMAPPPVPPAKRRGFGWLALGMVAAGGLLVGSVLGVSASSGTSAAPAVTVTATATHTVHVTAPTSAPTTEPTSTEPTAAGFTPHKGDFTIGLKILKKECFGSAGCNISYRIKPLYVGDQTLPDSGTIEVTYAVTGGDSGPNENTFTIEGGSASFDKEESVSTSSSGKKLKVKVVDASYSE